MSTDPTEGERAERLSGQILRARAAIARDEEALAGAKTGRDFRRVPILEADLANRRTYLAELLAEQTRLATGGEAPKEPLA